MATNRLTDNESAGVGELVAGIVKDLEALTTQHIRLFKKDLREDFQHIRDATGWLAVGLGILLIGGVLLGVTLVYGLLALFPAMPAWVAFALITVVFLGAGTALLCVGRERIKQATPLAEKSIETLQEDVQWAKNPK